MDTAMLRERGRLRRWELARVGEAVGSDVP